MVICVVSWVWVGGDVATVGDMARTGRPKAELRLSDDERGDLTRWARRALSAQALALRARIILACADGLNNEEVAEAVGCHPKTVGKWRSRFIVRRLAGLVDEPRSGRLPTISDERVERVLVATLESSPAGATHWSRASMARHCGLSASTVGRIWKAFKLKPHLVDRFKVSTDPLFVEKVHDVVGLYLNPPEHAVVFCVDEKSQIQALDRSQPVLPMMPGMPARYTNDYVRHGTADLFAAFNIASGHVIAECQKRHRSVEWVKFLEKIDKSVPLLVETGEPDADPIELQIHIVADNYATHKTPLVQEWLQAHPRFHMHFTPTGSSWLNQVERWFGLLTDKLLRRGVYKSVKQLTTDIMDWVDLWNEDPKPFIWTKSAEDILESLAGYLERISGAGH